MERAKAISGTIAFLVTPVTVAGLVPQWLLDDRQSTRGLATTVIGTAGVIVGATAIVDSFVRFALDGRGTPAPVGPTESLVVTGLYRRVRNPMYVGVELVILGQAALFRQPSIVLYAAAVGLAVGSFVRWYEEPALRARFGARYDTYRAVVPAWLPRPGRAWRDPEA